MIALIIQIFTLRINEDFFRDFSERVPVRTDTEFAIDRLGGVCEVTWMLDSEKPDGVHDPDFMKRADRFVRWLERQPDVTHVMAVTALLRRLDAAVVPGTAPGAGVLPGRADAIEAYLNLYADTAPEGTGLRHLVSAERSALRIGAVLGDVDNNRLRTISRRAEAYLHAHVSTARTPVATGACSMFGEIAHRNIRSMFLGNGHRLRPHRAVPHGGAAQRAPGRAISLAPNILPPFAAFGVWALLRDEVGLAASVITATSLGVIVDATVHILTHCRKARTAGMRPHEAVAHSLDQCGAAIFAGAAILIAGFAVLGLSSFRITQDLGLLTAIALTTAILVDFLLLPPLLLLTDRSERRAPP